MTKRHIEIAAYAIFIAAIMLAPLVLEPFWLNRIAKYLVYGMLGIAVALSWGYAGILNLGQGLFFGAGAYMIAMSLKLASPTSLQQGSDKPVPDFMLWNAEPGSKTDLCCINKASFLWIPFQNQWFGVAMGIVLPVVHRRRHRHHHVSQEDRGRVHLHHYAGAGASGAAPDHRRPADHQRLQRTDRSRLVQARSTSSSIRIWSRPTISSPSRWRSSSSPRGC